MAEHLGKYKIDGFIAEGGMARILRAKTVGVGGVEKTVALKCLKGVMSKDDSYVQMLLDEARITVNMTHKNICQVYGLENDGNTYFMVMELIDGHRTGIEMDIIFMPIDQNQKILDQILNDLLGAEGNMLPGNQIHAGRFVMGIYIIKMPEGGFRFFNNRGKAGFFLRI